MYYCINCRHRTYWGDCKAIDGIIDILTGITIHGSIDVNKVRHSEAYCGADGRWFEKLEEEK